MKNNKKIIYQLISALFFVLYGIIVMCLIEYVFPLWQNIIFFKVLSWVIILSLSLIFIKSMVYRIGLFRKKIRNFSQNNLMDYANEILLDDKKLYKPLLLEGRLIIILQILVVLLELLLPLAIGYLSLNLFSFLSSVLVVKYFLNIFSYRVNYAGSLSKREIPEIYQLINKIKKQVGIKEKILVFPKERDEFEYDINYGKINLFIGVEILYLLNKSELESYIYEMCLTVKDEHFQSILKLSKISNLINYFIYRGLFPLEIHECGLFLGKINFYLSMIKGKNTFISINKLDSFYAKEYLKAKYKTTQFHLVNLYVDPNDYIKINPDDFIYSQLKVKKERMIYIPWFDKITKQAIHNSRDSGNTYFECCQILNSNLETFDYDFSEDFKDTALTFVKALNLNNIKVVNGYLSGFFESISFSHAYEKQYLKIKEPNFDDKLQLALSKFISREYDQCLNLAKELYQEKPNNDSVNFLLGNIYIKAFNSNEGEKYLNRNYIKHSIRINSVNLLEDFYARNGEQEKIDCLGKQIVECQRILIEDRMEENMNIYNDGNLIHINSINKINYEIINFIKEHKVVKGLYMYEKFSNFGNYLYIVLLIESQKELIKINPIKEYLINRDDVNAIIKVYFDDKLENLKDFQDYRIF